MASNLQLKNARVRKMTVMVIGVALLGSFATAFLVQKIVLGAMLRALDREKQPPL
jgi:hypothetical protein